MNYSSRFWLYAPISLFLLLACAAMLHWWIVAGAAEKKLAAWKGHEAVPGISLDWDSVAVGGFPFRLDADFTNFRVQGAAAHGPFTWSSEKFAAHALTYGRRQIVYEAAGRQTLSWTAASGNAHTVSFLPGSMHGSSLVDGKGLARFDLDIMDVAEKVVAIGRLQFHMRRDPDGHDLDLMIRADGLQAYGIKVGGGLQLYTTLSQAAALAPLLKGEKSWPGAIQQWRAQGGAAKPSQGVAAILSPEWFLTPLY
ncbi:MAG TPA: DUF2125 domain-containing protein [Rhizomicrobium sp.]|nr:DUF2125 domain-containing protein [Rhizomicrobium sp.]